MGQSSPTISKGNNAACTCTAAFGTFSATLSAAPPAEAALYVCNGPQACCRTSCTEGCSNVSSDIRGLAALAVRAV